MNIYNIISFILLSRYGYPTAPHTTAMLIDIISSLYIGNKLVPKSESKSLKGTIKWIFGVGLLVGFFYLLINAIFTPIWFIHWIYLGYFPSVIHEITSLTENWTSNIITYFIGSSIMLFIFSKFYNAQYSWKPYIPLLVFFCFWIIIGFPTSLPLIDGKEPYYPNSLLVGLIENLFAVFFSYGFIRGINVKIKSQIKS